MKSTLLNSISQRIILSCFECLFEFIKKYICENYLNNGIVIYFLKFQNYMNNCLKVNDSNVQEYIIISFVLH